MKVVTRVVMLLVATLLLAGSVLASEDNWSILIKPDDGLGTHLGPTLKIGVGTAYTSPYDFIALPAAQDYAVVGAVATSLKDVQILPSDSPYPRVWQLRVAALPGQCNSIRLRFYTDGATKLPPATVLGGRNATYSLRMVDNKGVEGAPANGTKWSIPVPSAHSAAPFWELPLPVLTVDDRVESLVLSQGYKMEFVQTAVPEPSSLMALGLGMTGLLAFRRRK